MRRELCFEGLFCGELILEGRIGFGLFHVAHGVCEGLHWLVAFGTAFGTLALEDEVLFFSPTVVRPGYR